VNAFLYRIFMFEYVFIGKYFLVALLLSLFLTFLSLLLVKQKPELEKLSSYECGFNPFGDARSKFDVKFYLIGILFLIFDLELAFIFPWVVSWFNLLIVGKMAMYIFLMVLTIGFIIELRTFALALE
jgi:NADH:ubiquinone oxidoreductase subunit 3 (subunit A)